MSGAADLVELRDDPGRPIADAVDVYDIAWVDAALDLAGLLRVVVQPAEGRTWCLVALLGDDEPVVVLDHDLPLVTHGYEFRSSGIWLELVVEEPLEQWTVGLEAFGLRVDADEVVTPDSVGERVPFGLDLDVEARDGAIPTDNGFRQLVSVRGEVLVGTDGFEVDAVGWRHRATGITRPALDSERGSASVRGSLAVVWPDQRAPEVRVWVGGSRPGWVSEKSVQADP